MKSVFVVEGLDRLGKDTLIEQIIQTCGYYQVCHFSKPKALQAYQHLQPIIGIPHGMESIFTYQREGFLNAMLMANSGARIIFNRSWIGEVVYSPLYRGFSGDYVFEQEISTGIDQNGEIRLILLTEDFDVARHFVDDGNSLGAIDRREEEQGRFINAFSKSNIRDKRIISVTDPATGGFKSKAQILAQAID